MIIFFIVVLQSRGPKKSHQYPQKYFYQSEVVWGKLSDQ